MHRAGRQNVPDRRFPACEAGQGPRFRPLQTQEPRKRPCARKHLFVRGPENRAGACGAPSLSVHLRGRPGRAFHAHRDFRGNQHRKEPDQQLRPHGRRPDCRGDVPHRERDRPLGRTSSHRRYGGYVYRAGYQGRYRFDQFAQARHGQHGRHGPRAPFHQYRRQDSRRYPHPRVLRAYQVAVAWLIEKREEFAEFLPFFITV